MSEEKIRTDIKKAEKHLKWKPTYNIKNSVKMTIEWYYRVLQNKEDPKKVTSDQIDQYSHDS